MIGIKSSPVPTRGQKGLGQTLRNFATDQSGSLTIFSLVLFLLMVMMGGLAVDLMRYEQTRTSLQNTLDRATLASASLSQTLTPEVVVNDYFAKAGMAKYLTKVTVTQGLNFRNVEADATATSNPYFMQLIGQDSLDAVGSSIAEQRISNVEITLVLDVSGSMADNNRLVNLKSAAKEFVNTILSKDSESRISIAIVPFNGQVNIGNDLFAKYTNVSMPNGVSDAKCFDLTPSLYAQPGIPTNTPLSMTAHADAYTISLNYYNYNYNFYDHHSDAGQAWNYTWAVPIKNGTSNLDSYLNNMCPPTQKNTITLPSRSISDLQARIDALLAIGGTSIDTGFKWGLALMDPSLRTTYSQLISANKIPSSLAGRPFEYTDPEAMKVMVLMTDGQNSSRDQIVETYKTGNSDIYKSDADGFYSIRFVSGRPSTAGSNQYYVPHLNQWRSTPYASTTSSCSYNRYGQYVCTTTTGTTTQLTWPQVWATFRVKYVAWQFYARALSGGNYSQMPNIFDTWMAKFATTYTGTQMDSQLSSLCTLAKTKSVIVYGIAFEATPAGQNAIKNCATEEAYYFNASGLQISTAFRAIASNLSQLRLTQ